VDRFHELFREGFLVNEVLIILKLIVSTGGGNFLSWQILLTCLNDV
jgi:hypothetical protein